MGRLSIDRAATDGNEADGDGLAGVMAGTVFY